MHVSPASTAQIEQRSLSVDQTTSINETVNNVALSQQLKSSSTTSTDSTTSSNSITSGSVSSVSSITKVRRKSVNSVNNVSESLLPLKSFNLDFNLDECEKTKTPVSDELKEGVKNEVVSVISHHGTLVKKQPPPLMKKPEKSEEIMRKLGKSPVGETNGAGQLESSASPTSSISSSNSSSLSIVSNANSNNKTSNLSARFSNSRATDV